MSGTGRRGAGALAGGMLTIGVWMLCQALVPFSAAQDFFGPCSTNDDCSRRTGATVLGGFFPLHEWNYSSNSCSSKFRPNSGFQRLEAMRWAIEEYRGNLSIGYDLRDTCSKDTNTRDEALDFINVGTKCQAKYRDHPISLVIGASSSSVSADLTSLLTLFNVPQISYASTSTALNKTKSSDQARFETFYRTVPPDSYQVNAMVAVMKKFNWTYVSVIYSSDSYGNSGYEEIRSRSRELYKKSRANGSDQANETQFTFCLAESMQINLELTNNDPYEEAVTNLRKEWVKNSSIIIVFAQSHVARKLFNYINDTQGDALTGFEHITWIASDAWSSSVPTLEDIKLARQLSGRLIGFQPSTPLGAEDKFRQHLGNLTLDTSPGGNRSTWYREYFAYLGDSRGNTTAGSSDRFSIDPKVPFVIRAVQIALDAVRSVLTSAGCDVSNTTLCEGARSSSTLAVVSPNLTAAIESGMFNASFDDTPYMYGNITRSFLPVSGIRFQYTILSYNFSLGFVPVGTWSEQEDLALEEGFNVQNYPSLKNSFCAEQCPPGYRRDFSGVPQPDPNGPQCCWKCYECPINHFVDPSTDSCGACPKDTKSNKDRTGCVKLVAEYLKWSDALGIIMVILAIIIIILNTVIIVIFKRNWETPLVRASSRELIICLFAGFYLGALTTFFYVTEPTAITCALRRVGLSFSLTLCFSAMLVKTNRISRVFNRPAAKGRPPMISQEWTILFTCVFTLVQVVILVAWLIIQPPDIKEDIVTDNRFVQLVCKEGKSVGLYISLAYLFLLLLTVTIYGVRTRKIPENFNEARYISFSMYTITTVWLGFVPAYFATQVDFEAGLLGLPLVISIAAMLGFLFIPKIYVITFDKDRQSKSLTGPGDKSGGIRKYQSGGSNQPQQHKPSAGSGSRGRQSDPSRGTADQ